MFPVNVMLSKNNWFNFFTVVAIGFSALSNPIAVSARDLVYAGKSETTGSKYYIDQDSLETGGSTIKFTVERVLYQDGSLKQNVISQWVGNCTSMRYVVKGSYNKITKVRTTSESPSFKEAPAGSLTYTILEKACNL